jgi:hypothetical protein
VKAQLLARITGRSDELGIALPFAGGRYITVRRRRRADETRPPEGRIGDIPVLLRADVGWTKPLPARAARLALGDRHAPAVGTEPPADDAAHQS